MKKQSESCVFRIFFFLFLLRRVINGFFQCFRQRLILGLWEEECENPSSQAECAINRHRHPDEGLILKILLIYSGSSWDLLQVYRKTAISTTSSFTLVTDFGVRVGIRLRGCIEVSPLIHTYLLGDHDDIGSDYCPHTPYHTRHGN